MVVEVFCEWDVGQEYVVFASEEAARRWLEENEVLREMFEDDESGVVSVEDLIDQGLVVYRERELLE